MVINGCVKCDSGYYSTGSTCVAQSPILNCNKYHLYFNKCVECKSNFIPTDIGTCVPKINKCLLANSTGSSC